MHRIHSGIAVSAIASLLVGASAIAQQVEEVPVTATRTLDEKPAGHTSSGIPLIDISLSYGVSYAGLDLATHSGAVELDKRVTDAASEACKEISRQRPLAILTPDDASCARDAAKTAMVKVDELVAAAERKSAK